jgi:hypothetical protein
MAVRLAVLTPPSNRSDCDLRRQYPYPFLNQAKQPQGMIIAAICGVLIFTGAFRLGRRIAVPARAWAARAAAMLEARLRGKVATLRVRSKACRV